MITSFFQALDAELQKDLIDFVESESNREKKTLGESVVEDILRKIISGNCKITGCCTNHETKEMFVRFSFFYDEGENK